MSADTLRAGGYAVVEAGNGTGKSQGYLLPAVLYTRAMDQAIAVSTFTRVLQNQLMNKEISFIQQLVPGLICTQLQGRANYLSLSRLAKEPEDAMGEETLQPARAWLFATLVRFAATSTQGNLEELVARREEVLSGPGISAAHPGR